MKIFVYLTVIKSKFIFEWKLYSEKERKGAFQNATARNEWDYLILDSRIEL